MTDNPSGSGDPRLTSIQARSAALHYFADHSMTPEQAGEAVQIDLGTLASLTGGERSTALGTMGRIAESQGAYAEALGASNPAVSAEARTTSDWQRDDIVRVQTEYRQSPEGKAAAPQAEKLREAVRLAEVEHDRQRTGRSYADLGPRASGRETPATAQALDGTESRPDGRQAVPTGALDAAEGGKATTLHVAETGTFSAATQSHGTAPGDPSPRHASLADPTLAGDQRQSAAKEDREALDLEDRGEGAAQAIVTRYAAMGQPAHPRDSQARALVAESPKSDVYRATFQRETAAQTLQDATPDAGMRPGFEATAATVTPTVASGDRDNPAPSMPVDPAKAMTAGKPDRPGTEANAMQSVGATTARRRAIPPLEDRFNVFRSGLVEKEYRFRDQAGKVAFTDKLLSISTASESPAAIKAMVGRAAERGWQTVRLAGSPEFVRQGWIAANAQGLKAVGHTPTPGDREAAGKERARLDEIGRSASGPGRQVAAIDRVRSGSVERVNGSRSAAEHKGQRQLAAAIEKALLDAKVSPEIVGQVRTMMAAEGARRVASGERLKVPVYDARAPRARGKTTQAAPQRLADRERSR